MIYRDFQGMKLSGLGFGAMRLPVVDGDDSQIDRALTIRMVDEAMAADVAVFSDDRLRQHDAILPHPGGCGDRRLAVGQGMYHWMKSKKS